jgi:hypothetical protein
MLDMIDIYTDTDKIFIQLLRHARDPLLPFSDVIRASRASDLLLVYFMESRAHTEGEW